MHNYWHASLSASNDSDILIPEGCTKQLVNGNEALYHGKCATQFYLRYLRFAKLALPATSPFDDEEL